MDKIARAKRNAADAYQAAVETRAVNVVSDFQDKALERAAAGFHSHDGWDLHTDDVLAAVERLTRVVA